MNFPLLFLSVGLALLIAVAAYLLHSLKASGAVAAFFVIAPSLYLGSWGSFTVLVSSFALIAVVGRLTRRKTHALSHDLHEKTGARDAIQVLANGAPATLTAVLYFVTGNAGFLFAYAATIAEALSDSLASDVGVLSKKPPRDALSFRPVSRGISGGVSLLGTLSALAGCVAVAALTVPFLGFDLWKTALLVVIPFCGVYLDSILGARLQCRRVCRVCGKATEKKLHCVEETAVTGGIRCLNNDGVNLSSNLVTAAVASLIFIFI